MIDLMRGEKKSPGPVLSDRGEELKGREGGKTYVSLLSFRGRGGRKKDTFEKEVRGKGRRRESSPISKKKEPTAGVGGKFCRILLSLYISGREKGRKR